MQESVSDYCWQKQPRSVTPVRVIHCGAGEHHKHDTGRNYPETEQARPDESAQATSSFEQRRFKPLTAINWNTKLHIFFRLIRLSRHILY